MLQNRASRRLRGAMPVFIASLILLFIPVAATAADISPEMLTAARGGDLNTVKKLIALGEDVNAANAEGVTALMVAAAENRLTIVRALLETGADARMKTASGKTALFFADAKGNTEVVKLLQEAPTNPPRPNQPTERPKQSEAAPNATEHYNKGAALRNSRNDDAAAEQFRLATVADPSFSLAYYQRGMALFGQVSMNKDGSWRLPLGMAGALQSYLALDPSGQYSKDVRDVLTNLGQPLSTPEIAARVAAIRKK